jgi:hypothetical protein
MAMPLLSTQGMRVRFPPPAGRGMIVLGPGRVKQPGSRRKCRRGGYEPAQRRRRCRPYQVLGLATGACVAGRWPASFLCRGTRIKQRKGLLVAPFLRIISAAQLKQRLAVEHRRIQEPPLRCDDVTGARNFREHNFAAQLKVRPAKSDRRHPASFPRQTKSRLSYPETCEEFLL